jgi:hypothetical protein
LLPPQAVLMLMFEPHPAMSTKNSGMAIVA